MPTAVAITTAGVGLLGAHTSNKASKRAARSQQQGQAAALEASKQAAELARSQALPLFNAAQENRQQGFQGALDVFGQSVPAQMNAFQGGNMNAQNTLLAGMDPQIAAILGGSIDLSGLQAQQVQAPDPQMFQQQLPDFTTTNQALGLNQQGQPLNQPANPFANAAQNVDFGNNFNKEGQFMFPGGFNMGGF